MIIQKHIVLVFFFVGSSFLLGQKQIWDIYTIEDQPYSNVVLDTMQNDTLCVKSAGATHRIELNSIKILRRRKDSKAGIGTLTGMLLGGVAMNLYSRNAVRKQSDFPVNTSVFRIGFNTGLGMLGGGLLGFAVGAGLGLDEYYNFSKLPYKKKKNILKNIFKQNH